MKRLLFFVAIILMAGYAYADDCAVVDIFTNSNVKGGGNWEGVWVNTEYCVSYTIRNDGSVDHFDPRIRVLFANGSTG